LLARPSLPKGKPAPRPFKYFDKGNMATISHTFAVMELSVSPWK